MSDIDRKGVQLTLTQQIALQKVSEEVALARRNLARAQERQQKVLAECGVEPGNYNMGPDGVLTVVETPKVES
jgi:hypothetical protein